MPDIRTMPTPITSNYLEELQSKIKETTSHKGLIIVDTFRSAFLVGSEQGAENDSAAIVML